jgi:glycosyltransferase involved in cell wall biosynthesis
MKLTDITPLILTHNEEANIARCLAGLEWAQSIVILDSGSSDGTQDLCRSYPAVHWHQRPFDTHAKQWNAGLHLIQTSWVLTMDADYLLSVDLMEEIRSLPDNNDPDGYHIPFIYQINGHSLHQSLLPPRLALFKKDKGAYIQDGHTQDLILTGSTGILKGYFLHDDRKPFSRWWASQERYADMEVEKLSQTFWSQLRLQDKLRKLIFPAPPAVLFFTLFVKGCLCNGRAGWIYAGQRFLAEALLSFKLVLSWLKS